MKNKQWKLPHVLWLGGASDAGKTTIAQLLATRNRWQLYLCDMHEHNHFIARANPNMQPVMYSNLGKSIDEKWVFTTPEKMFQGILETNNERFPMVCDDLSVMPSAPPILVEGPRLFPKLDSHAPTVRQQMDEKEGLIRYNIDNGEEDRVYLVPRARELD